MSCDFCLLYLNNGMIKKQDSNTGNILKSCPHCSDANGQEHVFHLYPSEFTTTVKRITPENPDGWQSYCNDCRSLKQGEPSRVWQQGLLCSELIELAQG